jgi:hypothetical protein
MDVPRLPTILRNAAVIVAVLAGAVPVHAQGVDEAELKAAFVFNFVSFVTWPEATAPTRELALCVREGSSSERAMRRLHGARSGAMTIAVDVLSSAREVDRCHVVVADFPADSAAPAQAGEDAAWPHRWWRHRGVLSVADGGSAETNEAAITLVREDTRIRFDIDAGNATAAGLGLSSKLLRLARRVL